MDDPNPSIRAALVGAGEMGMPLAARVAAAGMTMVALARRPEVADALAAVDVLPAATIADAVAAADVVVICVRTDAQVADVALRPDGILAAARPGAVVAIHTTGSPSTAARLADAGHDHGVAVLDAPFSGSPSQVQAGTIPLLVGGTAADLDAALPVLAAYGDPVHLGALGSGQRVKLLNNLLLAGNAELALEVVRLGQEQGFAPEELVEVLSRCSGRSNALAMLAGGGWAPAAVGRLGGFLGKDIDVAQGVAAELDLDLGSLGRTAAEARRRFAAAAGD